MSVDRSEIFLRKKICPNPFILMEVLSNGNVAVCCPGRLKPGYRFVGNILEHSLDQIWNGAKIQAFRGLMYSGAMDRTCAAFCPQLVALREGKVPPWYSALCDEELHQEIEQQKTQLDTSYRALSISSDGACNLYCLMCRHEKQPKSSELEQRVNAALYRQLLTSVAKIRFLELTGNGDPFFNRDTVRFLEQLEREEVGHLTIRFITNGQLLDERRWQQIRRIGLRSVRVAVSIDAASKESYQAIRRGGSWETLVRNMEMLAAKRRSGELDYLQVSFVVMKRNIEEMIPFVALARSWHCDRIEFQRIMYDFAGLENVFDIEDPVALERLAEVLKSPVFGDTGFVDASSLLRYRDYRCSREKMKSYRKRVLLYRGKTLARRVAQGLGLGALYRHLRGKAVKGGG